MPNRLTIEVVKHSEDDVRIVANHNGKRRREKFTDSHQAYLAIRSILSNSEMFDGHGVWRR